MRKTEKGFWEHLYRYPSFNVRFISVLITVVLVFIVFTYLALFEFPIVSNVPEQIALLNLVIQGATLVLGIFAAYYALRQLVETRFTGLDQAGMQELKRHNYYRAVEKWKEAFYIKPEIHVFTNMCESLLLAGDYYNFDLYIGMSRKKNFLKGMEISDQQIIAYLNSIRHLLVENQGEAKKNIRELVGLVKKEGLNSFHWDFADIQTCLSYMNLQGDCKVMAENLILYLAGNMQPARKVEFQDGDFASQAPEPVEHTEVADLA